MPDEARLRQYPKLVIAAGKHALACFAAQGTHALRVHGNLPIPKCSKQVCYIAPKIHAYNLGNMTTQRPLHECPHPGLLISACSCLRRQNWLTLHTSCTLLCTYIKFAKQMRPLIPLTYIIQPKAPHLPLLAQGEAEALLNPWSLTFPCLPRMKLTHCSTQGPSPSLACPG
eukprot:617453-Pelagomonas_calceolata.AAC.2